MKVKQQHMPGPWLSHYMHKHLTASYPLCLWRCWWRWWAWPWGLCRWCRSCPLSRAGRCPETTRTAAACWATDTCTHGWPTPWGCWWEVLHPVGWTKRWRTTNDITHPITPPEEPKRPRLLNADCVNKTNVEDGQREKLWANFQYFIM